MNFDEIQIYRMIQLSSFFVFQKSIDAEHLISVFHFSRI
ncbi:hypothetical protein LEP1GSC187_3623 [Leptospira santarosai str. ZUN179]|uniref:Uncharacterized protein n=1 Tax=Leptospira santarosai str. ZUN179 TaxID=1049985 RepID=M6V906_9LEPT|nr:hypothetical protein LEP1GSC187_3623 [Leptospira santarosai str. ZUN179]